MRDEKNEPTISEVVAPVPKSATHETLGHLIHETIKHATQYRDVSNAWHSLNTSRVGDEAEHREYFAKLKASEADLLDVLKTDLVMALAAYERIKIIKVYIPYVKLPDAHADVQLVENLIKEVMAWEASAPKCTTLETLGDFIRKAIEHATQYRDDVLKTHLVMALTVYGQIKIIKIKKGFGFLYK